MYFGSSTQSAHDGASFLKYDPRTQQITFLAYDLTTICHKDPQTNPQGKLHSDIVEANGWLYMSNQFGSALLSSYPAWSGLHVIGYQLATGQFRDYGVNSGYWNKLLPAAPCSHWPVNWWCSPIGQDLPRRSGLRCYGRDLCNMTTTNLSTNGGRITG